jgi:tetratricopeptide (TPR) repeat protein
LNRPKNSPPAPVTQPVSRLTEQSPSPEKISEPPPEAQPTVTAAADTPEKIAAAVPAASKANPDDSTNQIHKAVDALLSAKSAGEKHDLFQQLIKSGQLEAAIAELKQRAVQNPNDAEIPTTLGEALLNEVRALKESGADNDQLGILAMQADQSFNAALKIDPQNWEAQFVKAASMYYWPPDPTRDAAVVQSLSSLIDQQETMTPNPAFAQTYLVLGNQYQKMGQPDKALATWQLGLQKFPNDPTLQKKVNGQ